MAKTIVKSYARDVSSQMRRLYERREAQCSFDDPQRRPLARARISMTRLAPDFASGGGGLPRFLVGGAVLSALASVLKQVGDLRAGGALSLVVLGVIFFVLFAVASWVIVQGAAVAHRRSTLIMRAPLAALWETIGACGQTARGRLADVRDDRHHADRDRLVRDAARRRRALLLGPLSARAGGWPRRAANGAARNPSTRRTP